MSLKKTFLSSAAALLVAVTATFPVVAHAVDRDFTVRNDVGKSLLRIYCSPSTDRHWGSDWLGEDLLETDTSVTLRFDRSEYPDECVFDVKVVDGDGTTSIVHNIDLCTITTLTFSSSAGRVVASSR